MTSAARIPPALRPHCEAPSACKSASNKHCRSCSARVQMMRINADPAAVERRLKAVRTSEVSQAHRRTMERLKQNPAFQAARAANGHRMMDNLFTPRRFEKSRAARLRRTALRAGIPEELVSEYRVLTHRKKLTKEEAVALLAREHREIFRDFEQSKAAAKQALLDANKAAIARQRRIIVHAPVGNVTAILMGDPCAPRSVMGRRMPEGTP